MKLPERFIVVDDDRTSNMICEFSLRRFSSITEIKTFVDPEDALQFIRDCYLDNQSPTPTILFLDINMPVFTGWDFLEIFNSFSQHIREQFTFYILTSSIEQKDVEKAEANPLVKGLLSKPLSTSIVRGIF
ncbi:response regulator [Aequorivita sp. CIP111184]|uniref:response regulator n=1 Tax=Aequorivita sp. CIP111184 TaxID=2211356 RepID=UPI000DBC3174|nr:response regulator [Aequorivita sp. CIP111184]SRX54720.1 hypothetical protein AEQU1_01732 [Aequorivita sp. CIP111184]